ncbi:hypothetical protein HELRODRAFT_182452 [Helobdella robusta]|uniref:Uncharacterized protein n=1 Tax=Helobdella robusta TaxID=6412 RepID=T1FI79_HELRO|nr:hypothetical protein HELRODRAFT_182452 [Helobdella robusta]ESN90980.1 hypothetical protein HELRODRAFT_182452 [Helobdella robusta]
MCDIYGPGWLTFDDDAVTLRSLYKDGKKTWTYQQLQKATCSDTSFQLFIAEYSDWMYFEYVPGHEMKKIFDYKKSEGDNRRWLSMPKSQKLFEGIKYLWK